MTSEAYTPTEVNSVDAAVLREKAAAAKAAVADLASEAKKVAVGRLTDIKNTSADWISDKKDLVVDKSREYKDNVGDYVQQNPFKSVAIAAGVGFLVGLLLKRR